MEGSAEQLKARNGELKYNLEEANIKALELEADIDDFIFVTSELMRLFGIDPKSIVEGKVEARAVVKKIKSNLLQAMSDPDGFSSLFTHISAASIRIGDKYQDRARIVVPRKMEEYVRKNKILLIGGKGAR